MAAPLALRIAGYFEGENVRQAYAAMRTPMLSLSFTDDEMMSEQGIRLQFEQTLWPLVPQWLALPA